MRMQEMQSPESAGWAAALLYKLLPGALGALVMVLVDVPKTKKDLFTRLFVAFISSVVFGELFFDWLRTLSAFSFLSPFKGSHVASVYFLVGGFGWFVIGGGVTLATRWRDNPSLAGIFGHKPTP